MRIFQLKRLKLNSKVPYTVLKRLSQDQQIQIGLEETHTEKKVGWNVCVV